MWAKFRSYNTNCLTNLTNTTMAHEKEVKEKSGKKIAAKSLKEKRADKAAKRKDKKSEGVPTISPFAKPKK